ncbi:N-acetyltransferase [archaeon]|nr:N-acetyltransferase [archaeon]|tara:strand:+ start:1380 stop:1931 length:552 start_codon:yes stop_codon:yes gene_type:complete
MSVFISDTAVVDPSAKIGEDTKIWHFSQIRDNVVIGNGCNIANGVYIDSGVEIGNNVSIQNKSSIYRPVVIEDDVFIGPNVCLANDKNPRSGVIRDLEGISWTVHKGASIGANTVIMPDVIIGKYALVGAGSVVTKDVPEHALMVGNPAKVIGYVCECGQRLDDSNTCLKCKKKIDLVRSNGK